MKRVSFLLMMCLTAIGLTAQNFVTLSSAQGAAGEEVTILFSLQNTDNVSAIQFGIPLGDYLTYVDGSAKVEGSRCPNHSISAGTKDGQLNILLYSTNMNAISGSEGVIASFRLRLGNQAGELPLYPSEVMLTGTDGSNLEGNISGFSVTIQGAKAEYDNMVVDFGKVSVTETATQDINVTNTGNADLVITGLEFSETSIFTCSTSLPMTVSPGDTKAFGITCSPKVREAIEEAVKVICNSVSKRNTITLKAEAFTINELHIQPVQGIADEEVTVAMTMNNMDAVNGCQIIFDMPEELEYVDGSFTLSNRKADHVSTASQNDKTLQIVVYSQTGKAFDGNDGEIGSFKIKLTGRNSIELKPSKAVLSATINNKVEDVISAVFGGQITISSPRISTNNALDLGAVPITETAEKTLTINNTGDAPLTVSRILFDNENLSVKETLPITVEAGNSGTITVIYGSVEQTSFDARMKIYSNDPEQRLKEVEVMGSRFAPNYFTINTSDITTEENLSININVNTYDAISGLQFDLVYPEQYYEPFDENFILEDRAKGMTVTSRQMDSSTLRYFCYFLSSGSITAGEGKVITIQMKPKSESVPVGTYKVNVKDIKLGTSEMADKYAGTYCESSFEVFIEEDPVTITAKSYNIAYGDDLPNFEFESSGATLVGIPEINCEATTTSPVGTYDILISKGSVTNKKDTYVNGTLTITKAPLTIKAGTYTRKRGEENPEFTLTYEGFKNNETVTVLTKQATATTTATKESAVGDYTVTVNGAEAQNYEISYENGTLKVTEADPVTVTAKSYTRVYGEANPTFEYETSGAALVGIPEISCEATTASPVGTYDIIIKKGSVTNYNDTYVKGTLTITKAPLTIKAGTYTRKQGEDNPEFTLTYEGLKNDETKDVLTKQPTATTAATKESALGDYTVTVSGAEASNYEISYENGTLKVTDADAVIVTAKDYTRVYGEDNPIFEYTTSGTALVGTPEISCEATAVSPVGTYDIIIKKGSVTNYNDTYVKGTLTITKAPLTIKAGTYTRKQGEENPEFTLTYEGFKNDETKDVLTKQPTATTAATKESPVGEYTVTVSGAEAQNYEITYENGKLTVTEADPVPIIIGDANDDGEVDAKDIVDIVNHTMGKPTSTGKFNDEAADANEDGAVNAADIVTIVNYIMTTN